MAEVTFGMLGSVIFDMAMAGGPVPPGYGIVLAV